MRATHILLLVASVAGLGCPNRSTPGSSSAVTPLPRQCGQVDASFPEQIVCPRGWSACLATTTLPAPNPHYSTPLRQIGLGAPMPAVVWRDLDQDGVRDGEARYRYDHRGNVTRVWVDSNANGIPEYEARYTYDARGLLTEAWSDHYFDASGPSRSRYKYNRWGWLTDGEEGIGDGDAHSKVKYRYDAAGRIISSSTGDAKSEVHFEYNAAGDLVREWSASSQKRYSYDAQHRVTRVWTDANPGPTLYEERRTYDAAGRLVQAMVTGAGRKPSYGNLEYDAAGRQIRAWSDEDGDGSPESDTRTTYDAAGRVLAVHEDRDGNGKPDVSHGTDYDADGRPIRRWRDTDGDGRPNQETVSTYDRDGHLINEVTYENRRPSAEVRWEYKDGRPVRWWNALHANVGTKYEYDAEGNVVAEIDANTGATHYEYDAAALAALRKAAPAQCTAASAPFDDPAQRALALDPQRVGGGSIAVHQRAPGRLVAPKAPGVPTLDAAGYLAGEPHALVEAYERYVDALREQAFADRGWTHVAIHRVPAGTSSRHIRGVRVAKDVRECGEPSQYMIDRQRKVFEPNPAVTCKRQIVVKVRGSIAAGGCGTEPPAVDLYAEVADGARAESGTRPLPLTIPVCLEFRPDDGFSHPP